MNGSIRTSRDSRMLTRQFFRLLPIQILVVAMNSANIVVDGIIAARYIRPESLGVMGLYYSMVLIMESVSTVLMGGTTVLCGRHMGSGRLDRTRGLFSLNLTLSFLIGLFLTLFSVFFPKLTAAFLGAGPDQMHDLIDYTTRMAIGFIPHMLSVQLVYFLSLERQQNRGYIGVGVMIAINAGLDFLFIGTLNMGMSGLALASAVSEWLYFGILGSFFLTRKAQIRFRMREVTLKELPELLKIGFPEALLVFLLTISNLVINRLLLTWSGEDGLSALSAFNMMRGFLICVPAGMSAVLRILVSVYIGEEDASSIRMLLRLLLTRMMLIMAAMAVMVILLSGVFAGWFCTDHDDEVYRLTRQLFIIFGACLPLVLACMMTSNYYQSVGQNLLVNIQSVMDGLVGKLVPSLILAPLLGATGVWLMNPIGMLMTLLAIICFLSFRNRHFPRAAEDWLMLRKDFGTGQRLALTIRTEAEAVRVSEEIQTFCLREGLDRKESYMSALCMEESVTNIIQHGFQADRRKHTVDLCVTIRDRDVILHIKDDCIPFNPRERSMLVNPDRPESGVGIRLLYAMADEVTYQSLLGLNVLTVTLKDRTAGVQKAENAGS